MAGASKNRPMDIADIPRVTEIFMKIFRQSQDPPSEALKDYFRKMYFTSPNYNIEVGSLVHDDADGKLDGVLQIMPMSFSCRDHQVMGRMLSGFMVDEGSKRGGADLAVAIKARNQDFTFSETAKPISADMMNALGGITLPIQSLEWVRIFRPAGLVAAMLARGGGWKAKLPIRAPARLADKLFRRFVPKVPERPEGFHDEPIEREDFIALAPTFLSQYAVRPTWAPDELRFIIEMAALKTKNGPLNFRKLVDAKGATLGLFAYYGEAGRIANVLNMLSAKGKESQVISGTMAALEAAGCVAARGMCQPRQIDWLYRDRGMFFRHNAYFVVMTKHEDFKDAVQRNDIYIGGLGGETWSRLVSDHF